MVTGYEVKKAREKKGWTQEQLAKYLRASRRQVIRWEHGIASVSKRFEIKILELLENSQGKTSG